MDSDYLLRYVAGSLSAREQHRIEELMNEDPFLSDALDGLAEIKDPARVRLLTAQINSRLRKQVQQRKQKKLRKRPTDTMVWMYVILLLLLAVVGWWLIKIME